MTDDTLPPINGQTALLIVDVQKGFINEQTQHIPPLINSIQTSYSHIIATRFYNEMGSAYRKLLHWHRFDKDSEDFSLAINLKENTLIVDKNRYSVLTALAVQYLRDNLIDTVHIAGIDTNACVMVAATELFETHHIRPIVLSKYCASHSGEKYHQAALDLIEKLCGREQIWMN